ncbi:MAG: AFG1/ZapE family ATPase [Gammaproteobacteria bacterium]
MVDTFYDRNVKLIVSAGAAPVSLYRGRGLQNAFQRKISRLEEMQTHAYLAKDTRPKFRLNEAVDIDNSL